MIVPKFTKKQITELLRERKERIYQAVLLRLKKIGEAFVKNARENGNYKDRTGNLRSSVGYVILRNGEQLFQNFKAVGADGKAGLTAAKKVIDEAKGNFPNGLVLICVAGMEYAAAVESTGRDVITASSAIAEADLRKAIREIKQKVSNAA